MAGNLLNRFRYITLAVLIVVTAAYGYYLYRTYAPQIAPGPQVTVPVAVMVDGTIRIDGTLYADPAKLKDKVAALQKEHPNLAFNLTAPRGTDMVPIAKAVTALQQAGAKTIWVINEPKTPPEQP